MMEKSLLKSLLNSITGLSELVNHDSMKDELVQTYHLRIGEIFKLLKPILHAISDSELASDQVFEKEVTGLHRSVDELRERCENWQPLMSKLYFVSRVESLMVKTRNHGLEILELLKSFDHCLPSGFSAAALEHCIQKTKLIVPEPIITKAIKDHLEGSGTSPENLEKIADSLSLKLNQEILIEIVALDKLKENAEQDEKTCEAEYIDQIIALVTRMHDLLVINKQSRNYSPVPIPPDFCCPLSLELMSDPVIVASGQTYERVFIQKWIDLGLTVCPKTRHTLARTNLIPNYTVKALISHWCESNNVKLPESIISSDLDQSASQLASTHYHGVRRVNSFGPPDGVGSPIKNSIPSTATQRTGASQSHLHPSSETSLAEVAINGIGSDVEILSPRSSEDRSEYKGEEGLNSRHLLVTSPPRNDAAATDKHPLQAHRTNSASSTHSNSITFQGEGANNEVSSHANVSDASGLFCCRTEPDSHYGADVPQREPDLPQRLDTWTRGQTLRRRSSKRLVSRIVSSPFVDQRPDLIEVETEVKKLVEDLKSSSLVSQLKATESIRLFAKHNMENRLVIANCGAISLLVNLLRSSDSTVQEKAVTALLNLSININNKTAIATDDSINALIYVLENGNSEAKANSAATLFSLSMIEENKVKIGRSGAIIPLVDLLGTGTPRGKKDAATALFNLSTNHENKPLIVQAGAVNHLVELMDPAFGMVDKAVAVLSNLATIDEGRTSIGEERGLPLLVEVVELGSARSKENAAAALLQLCTYRNKFCGIVLQDGVVPPLVALSHSGTPRAREKAQQLLQLLRNKRHGNPRT
ncbi:ATP synthase alpha/beta family protein isoform 1 [Dorcoceras hygrometricum]|uniref:RING-type E3 ubiquitin transferase n=1 Tax=Dorcoceras hygrometricum TaxID=472368 RepID=A0A2Z7AUI2_9LAMI|nr:ATP synthase alpha/beta family protein isoform 1 [Dorcoceras hygrometricum]